MPQKMKCASFFTLQKKKLFCKKLAACLCMKPSKSPPLEPRHLSTKIHDVAAGNQQLITLDYIDSASSVPTAENNSVTELFKEIRDLLKTRVCNAEEQHVEDRKKHKMMKDWKLAAAVVDRICAFVFTVVFVGGTLAFIIVVTTHPSSSASAS